VVFQSQCRAGLSAADAVEAGEALRVVLFLMSNSVALDAVKGEDGPEHPDSGFKKPLSATQRPAELIQQTEQHMLPRIPRQ
jgi:hypothetical protein